MTTSIPASAIVSVTPSVISAGGSQLQLSGLILTANARVPIGQILSFPSLASVNSYFGAVSTEAAIAGIYFQGFLNSNVKPGAILFSQYNQNAVPAYIRGGSVAALTLPQLQALTGTLTVNVDGVAKTSGTINLSTATSFSNAASLIQTAFAAFDGVTSAATTIATGTATNGTVSSITGNIFTAGGTITGSFVVGGVLSGTGVTAGTTILNQLTGTAGGAGTYTVSAIQNVSSTTITQSYGLMTVAAMASGYLAVGQAISGGTIAAGTTITAQVTGTTGGAGTYVTSGGAQTVSATAVSAGPLTCSYDSVSGGFILTGGTPGTQGSIGYCTGSISASLNLTLTGGATLSQGAAAQTPASQMASVVAITTNWVSFMTAFDPDNGYGNLNKQAFAAWNNTQSGDYVYSVWDSDITPTTSNAATASLGYILKNNGSSGTFPVWGADYTKAAFICGAIASLDFTQLNGRSTFAYKAQAGLTPDVTNFTVASNLAANGYNYYGAWATAAQQFNGMAPGSVTGQFVWLDSYVDQIWLSNAFQSQLMQLLFNVKSIPYNNAGYAMIRAACTTVIQQFLNFGGCAPGVPLSPTQVAEVNNAAGLPIDSLLSSQGWYLQILPATAGQRALRATPPMTFWYMDGGSVQTINLASVEVE